jgi:hypothetical protein
MFFAVSSFNMPFHREKNEKASTKRGIFHSSSKRQQQSSSIASRIALPESLSCTSTSTPLYHTQRRYLYGHFYMGPLALFSNKQQQQHHPNQQENHEDDDESAHALLPFTKNDTSQSIKENQQRTDTTTATIRNNEKMGNTMSLNHPSCMNGNEATKKSILLSPLTNTDDPSSQRELHQLHDVFNSTSTRPSIFKHEEQPQLTTSLSAHSCPTVVAASASPSASPTQATKRRGRGWSALHSGHDDATGGPAAANGSHPSSANSNAIDNSNSNVASRHSWHAGEHHRSLRRRRKGHHHESINSSENNNNSMAIGHHHHHLGLHRLTAFMAHMSTSSSKGTSKIVRKTGKAFHAFLTHFEEFFFPKSALAHELAARSGNGHTAFAPKVRGGVLMEGCASPVEHYARIQHVVQGMQSLQGADGLRFCDLEYRLVHCPAHETVQEQELHLHLLEQQQQEQDEQQQEQLDNNHHHINYSGMSTLDEIQEHYQIPIANHEYKHVNNNKLTHVSSLPDLQGTGTDNDFDSCSLYNNNKSRMTTVKSAQSLMSMQTATSRASGWTSTTAGLDASHPPLTPLEDSEHCHLCSHRLVHIPTNTIIDTTNRKKYIADGDMYEAVARCCQEYAQDVMCVEGNLEWVTIEQQQEQQPSAANPDDNGDNHHHHHHHHYKPARAPIRALVNSNHPLIQTSASALLCDLAAQDNEQEVEQQKQQHEQQLCRDCRFESRRPTMIIATGKGKVMAGIFSRQHLMCTSLESATALPIVKECKSRHLNMVIPDPNVHGDAYGYDTFSKTMAKLFASWEANAATNEQEPQEGSNDGGQADDDDSEQQLLPPLQSRDLYILSHSASGAQVARYLLEKGDAYLPHIRAIAFTDSTHNIQWCKQSSNSSCSAAGSKNANTSGSSSSCNNKKDSLDGSSSSRNTQHHGDELSELLQSNKSIYFRCANERRDGSRWYLHAAGDVVKTDEFWKHRFGEIQTYWAGTNEHSLTNWYAHAHIWRHFDAFLDPLATFTRTSPSQEQQQHYQIPSSLLNFGSASDKDDEHDDGYSNDFALDLDEEDDICFDKIACTAPMTI